MNRKPDRARLVLYARNDIVDVLHAVAHSKNTSCAAIMRSVLAVYVAQLPDQGAAALLSWVAEGRPKDRRPRRNKEND